MWDLPTTGDADAASLVDEQGNVVDGDRIMYVCGKYLMEQGKLNKNTIVTTVMSNLGLYKACRRKGSAVSRRRWETNMSAKT